MENELKKRIMRRVYAIWFVRKVAPAAFVYMPFLAIVVLWETAREFFVARIIDNFLVALHGNGFMGVVNFSFSALVHTPVLPTLVILASMAAFFVFLRKSLRSLRQTGLIRSY